MQTFTIRDIENLTGIKAHTIRIWEQRYNFFTPKSKESHHRHYDNEDLKMMMRIAFLHHNGWKVSKIAKLSQDQITEVVRNTALKTGAYSNYVNKMI
ncbi:MAG TPA: MerR family transcriptional regulator [Flavisolibacter sp.]|nr:MerR family transcriptional regulator [Flavisolibacter sp.]